MGADGGVAWAIRRPDAPASLSIDELLRPWDLWRTGQGSSDASRSAWEEAHADPDWITAPYGTDLGDRPTLRDLPRVMSELMDRLTDPTRSLGPDATWQDLLDEEATRPSWLGHTLGKDTDWLETLCESIEFGYTKPDWLTRPVLAWCDALCTVLQCGPDGFPIVDCEETWT